MSQIRIAGIAQDSIVDGPGLRFTIFVQGCPHFCEGCHNPETHPLDGGALYSHGELLDKILENPLVSGVTISGGEPFDQAQELIDFAAGVKEMGKNLWIYTGYTWDELLTLGDHAKKLLIFADVIVDGRYVKSLRSLNLPFRGSSNQRLIDVPATILYINERMTKNERDTKHHITEILLP